ncbi:methylated-DNA--[protein]-cysteine S-methyltransferase [Pseudolabrys taiwanensis]|uniref:Methylated-DNA--protein-cysteine methyltransferase n=1 Tax=Pseudolabrys taiwanensis TaxID=331696 RepID=A0A345ZUH8_9HYPH|nr:methylated-DNA--[protein]-cysteine S-methyltransferase [Pseudolabrys taiwanensis]AXK80575.1 methylated-DNA--[protein]-cysteine S-methyltransferase [Pseudolabrys taiwanensis]
MTQFTKTMDSPVGALTLIANEAGLSAVLWQNDDPKRVRVGDLVAAPEHPVLIQAERELSEYFAGKLASFSVPLDATGTPFQKKAWAALLTIPYGETRSYGALARQLGNPKASRAVGAANGRNPLSIIVPCHRAIGADGALTGFAGGLDAKRYLLALEAGNTSARGTALNHAC